MPQENAKVLQDLSPRFVGEGMAVGQLPSLCCLPEIPLATDPEAALELWAIPVPVPISPLRPGEE